MDSKGSEDEAEEDEQSQQGIGKRVIGEPENFLVRSGVFSLLCMESSSQVRIVDRSWCSSG